MVRGFVKGGLLESSATLVFSARPLRAALRKSSLFPLIWLGSKSRIRNDFPDCGGATKSPLVIRSAFSATGLFQASLLVIGGFVSTADYEIFFRVFNAWRKI